MSLKETPPILKLLVLILPIAAVVFVSGCTTGGIGASGPGIVVLNWEPDHSSVESYDDVQLRLKVQNQGGEEAYNVRALITVLTFGGDEWLLRDKAPEVFIADYMIPPNPRYNTNKMNRNECVLDTVANAYVSVWNFQQRINLLGANISDIDIVVRAARHPGAGSDPIIQLQYSTDGGSSWISDPSTSS